MRRSQRRRERGFTLIEMVIVSGVFGVLATGIFSLLEDANGVYQTTLRSSMARRHCTSVSNGLATEIACANPANLAVDASHPEGDRVTLQLPLSVTNAVVTWGATEHLDRSGTPEAGAFVTYRLVQDPARSRLWDLVRHVVDAAGNSLGADEVLVSDVDAVDVRRGKGFQVVRNGDLVTLALRVRIAADDAGVGTDDVIRSHQVTVKLRNP